MTDQAGGSRSAAPIVMIVEDDDSNRLLLRRFLEHAGYLVIEASDGPGALAALGTRRPDVVVLDLGLPGLDGLDVLRRVRRESGVPVLVLSGRTEELSKLDGFAAGADDYVVKPFSIAELGARVQALLRRGQPQPAPERFEYGSLVIDAAAAEVTLRGERVALRPKELMLLAFLSASPGRVFSRAELLEHVWGSTANWQEAATVTEHVRRLRQRLGTRPDDGWCIETVRGLGYRFTATVPIVAPTN
jgi:two-component system phosphate regulon response regulator PhoB